MTRTLELLCAALLAPFAAAQNITATVEALAPITAAWSTAPPGTVGATVTHPAGPFTSVDLLTAGAVAEFTCDLTNDGRDWTLHAFSEVFTSGPGEVAFTDADLLLSIAAPCGTYATLDLELQHLGDSPDPFGFRIDVDDDGTYDVDTGLQPGLHRIRDRVLDLTCGGVAIRISSHNSIGFPPQAFELRARIREWSSHATPAAAGCGATAQLWGNTLLHDSNHFLDAVPGDDPQVMATLRAHGSGLWNWFVASDDAATVPFALPAPINGTCPLFQNVVLVDPGAVRRYWIVYNANYAWQWELDVPQLPPGFTFYMQHACAQMGPTSPLNNHFGTSNVLRIDT